MNKIIQIIVLTCFLVSGCNTKQSPNYEIAGNQSKIIEEMISAVNEKNAEEYVRGFADKVQVFVESDLKVDGKEIRPIWLDADLKTVKIIDQRLLPHEFIIL